MSDWTVKDYAFAAIFAAVVLGLLGLVLVRVADVYYKAGWIVSHFPPESELCTEPFCVRTDTARPESERTLELTFSYCPEHLWSGFQGRGGRSNAICVLVALLGALLSLVAAPIVGALFRVAAWPVLIPLRLAGKLPPGHLIPFACYSTEPAAGDWLEPAGMAVGGLVAVVAITLYAWC